MPKINFDKVNSVLLAVIDGMRCGIITPAEAERIQLRAGKLVGKEQLDLAVKIYRHHFEKRVQ